jgi:coenzyme F420-reducing hydrogenase alpha subunit
LCNAEFIKSHSLHLFLLVLPDYFGKESALEFDKKQMRWLKLGLSLKSVASEMTKAIGGRTYHNLTVGIGGFRQLPEQRKLEHLLHRLHEAKKDSIKAVELFSSLKSNFSFERKTNYLALVGKKYCLLCGEITSSTGVCIPEENYSSYFKEFVVPYSTAREVTFEGKEFMVGALARINLNEKEMCHDTKHLMAEHKLKFPNYSPFYNNIAQALEIVQCIDSSIEILNRLKIRSEPMPEVKPRNTLGIGVVEAPRGTLYHEYKFSSDGTIKDARIIVPTMQNQRNIEEDIKSFVPPLLKKSRHDIEHDLEKLIRAYDPCISCAAHFLKVKWK